MIPDFHGEYSFLSNFYPANVEFEGQIYPSVEHAYQAAKTLDFKLRAIFALRDMTAAQSKYLGRQIKCRADWDAVKDGIMKSCLASKFSDTKLLRLLRETGDQELVEGNTWGDTYWGVCNGVGLNKLGKFLMEVRDERPHST